MKRLPPAITIRLMHCFEACLQEEVEDISGITGQYLKDHYPELTPLLTDWFRTVGYAGLWQASYHDDYQLVELEACSDNQGKRHYLCPETFGTKSIDAYLTEVKQVRAEKIITWLAELLGISQYLHSAALKAVIPDCLWKLGDARLHEGFHYPVWLFRGAGTHTDALVSALQGMRGREKGIILTASDDISLPETLPDGFRWMPLGQALVGHREETCLDTDKLYEIVVRGHCQNDAQPVQYDQSRQTLKIAGKDPWKILGAEQAAAVEYLYEMSLQGIWEVQAKAILNAVHRRTNKAKGQGSLTVDSLFAGNAVWRQYICRTRRGWYGFSLV